MSCGVLERKAGSIRHQNEEITEDLKDIEDLQSVVWAANGLGCSWRSLVRLLRIHSENVDHRKLRAELLLLATGTLCVYDSILKMIDNEDHPYDGTADLMTSRHEAKNIKEWIESWPSSDPERLRAAREDTERGDVLRIGDLREELLGETA